MMMYEPEFEWKEGWEFLRDMPEKKRSHEVQDDDH